MRCGDRITSTIKLQQRYLLDVQDHRLQVISQTFLPKALKYQPKTKKLTEEETNTLDYFLERLYQIHHKNRIDEIATVPAFLSFDIYLQVCSIVTVPYIVASNYEESKLIRHVKQQKQGSNFRKKGMQNREIAFPSNYF